MKKAWIIIGIIAVALAVISVGKDLAIKMSVEKGVEIVTGLKLSMGEFGVSIIRGVVRIKDLMLFNPAGFKDRVMVDIPEIFVSCDLPAMFRGKVHLRKMFINLREMTVVKNELGQLNLNSFKVVQAQKEGKKPESGSRPMPEIQIDELRLKAGKAFYKDYSGGAPTVKEFDINLDEKYTNITDPYALVSLIIVKTLTNTRISSMANFDLSGLRSTIGGVLASAQTVTTKAAAAAQKAVQTTAKRTHAVAKNAEKVAAEAIKDIGDIFKSPFGGGK